jgi:hypothetical protein
MCQYLYREGDKKVVVGERNIGDCCTALPMKTGEAQGKYCYGHAQTLGLIPKEKLAYAARKRRATNLAMPTQDRKKSKEDRKNQAYDNETEKAKRGKPAYNPTASSMVDDEILDYLGVNQSYNALNDFTVQSALNEHPEVDDYAKKIVLARWMEAKDKRRLPKSIDELAGILAVTPWALNNWRHSRFVTELLAQDIRHRATKMEQFVVYHLAVAIKQGDLKAVELYQKYYASKPSEKERSKAPNLSKDLQQEAMDFQQEVQSGSRIDKTTREQGLILKESLIGDMFSKKTEDVTN